MSSGSKGQKSLNTKVAFQGRRVRFYPPPFLTLLFFFPFECHLVVVAPSLFVKIPQFEDGMLNSPDLTTSVIVYLATLSTNPRESRSTRPMESLQSLATVWINHFFTWLSDDNSLALFRRPDSLETAIEQQVVHYFEAATDEKGNARKCCAGQQRSGEHRRERGADRSGDSGDAGGR